MDAVKTVSVGSWAGWQPVVLQWTAACTEQDDHARVNKTCHLLESCSTEVTADHSNHHHWLWSAWSATAHMSPWAWWIKTDWFCIIWLKHTWSGLSRCKCAWWQPFWSWGSNKLDRIFTKYFNLNRQQILYTEKRSSAFHGHGIARHDPAVLLQVLICSCRCSRLPSAQWHSWLV